MLHRAFAAPSCLIATLLILAAGPASAALDTAAPEIALGDSAAASPPAAALPPAISTEISAQDPLTGASEPAGPADHAQEAFLLDALKASDAISDIAGAVADAVDNAVGDAVGQIGGSAKSANPAQTSATQDLIAVALFFVIFQGAVLRSIIRKGGRSGRRKRCAPRMICPGNAWVDPAA